LHSLAPDEAVVGAAVFGGEIMLYVAHLGLVVIQIEFVQLLQLLVLGFQAPDLLHELNNVQFCVHLLARFRKEALLT